ncbi:MAG: HAMP domain-containing sensor histidine kinase [Vicinamibacteria bacterium]
MTAAVHRSVFAKLVAIMIVMALCLVGMVFAFFMHVVNPLVSVTVDRMLGDYSRRIAADAPDLEEARDLAGRYKVQIRYEGPDGAWTTDETLPAIGEVVRAGPTSYWRRPMWGQAGYLASSTTGGRYFFSWEFGKRAHAAHDQLLAVLLVSMIAVFASAHLVMSRALRPLRALQDGVARLSAGDLDVALPNHTRDEFGALTDAFNRMAGRVRDMVQARDRLLVDVSHELRSPLTRLKVALALLPDSSKKAQAEADVAEMEALTTGLLELERLRDGRALRIAPTDIAALVADAVAPHRDAHPGVLVSAAGALPTVEVDADGVRTVLRNLLENAAKYALPDSRPVRVAASVAEGSVTVVVEDDGPGIPAGDLERVFEPFFRVDRSRSRKTGGYGLGLSICKRIAEAHGGRIEASAVSPRGVRFVLTLPARAA